MYNSIYHLETITVLTYFKMSIPLLLKFKLLREAGGFYLPNDKFLTQDYLNDIISCRKSLIFTSSIKNNIEHILTLKTLSHLFYDLEPIAKYIPSSFTKSCNDGEYLANLIYSHNALLALKIQSQHQIFKEISNFKFEKPMRLKIALTVPKNIALEEIWKKLSDTIEKIEDMKSRITTQNEIELRELEGTRIAKEITSKSYNDDLFDKILEVNE